jgi:divalent metal cation (Fe/Co/Zn/Cd) transporter
VKIGKQANSKVLIANAWHHRTDAISSVVALGGIVGSMAGVPLLDPGTLRLLSFRENFGFALLVMWCYRVVAGMAVAAMIVKTGGEICLDRYVPRLALLTACVGALKQIGVQCTRAHGQHSGGRGA